MKTTKLILGTILVALQATSFAQHNTINGKFNHNRKELMASRCVTYRNNHGSTENRSNDPQSRADYRIFHGIYGAPFDNYSCLVNNFDVIHEHKVLMESWMSVPFGTAIPDQELILEGWMRDPFDAGNPLE